MSSTQTSEDPYKTGTAYTETKKTENTEYSK